MGGEVCSSVLSIARSWRPASWAGACLPSVLHSGRGWSGGSLCRGVKKHRICVNSGKPIRGSRVHGYGSRVLRAGRERRHCKGGNCKAPSGTRYFSGGQGPSLGVVREEEIAVQIEVRRQSVVQFTRILAFFLKVLPAGPVPFLVLDWVLLRQPWSGSPETRLRGLEG